jgi:NADPH-dependent glutamate synthase beta subunit-like oxidoreductase
VIPAIGQIPSVEAADFISGPELTKWGAIKVDPVHKGTTARGIFAGGDCVSGPGSVIDAIAAGQKAAMSIDKLLGGSGELPQDTGFSFAKPDEEALDQALPRFEEEIIPLSQRRRSFAEVVLGIDREQALAEAGRCLRCDLEK